MGETDEKGTAPAATTNESQKPETPQPGPDGSEVEAKETEKLLGDTPTEALEEVKRPQPPSAPAVDPKPKASSENVANGEEIINIPEDVVGGAGDGTTTPADGKKDTADDPSKGDKPNKVQAEEREVKPKKVPAGAFKLPGFFNKNKDKPKEADGADNELLEKNGPENGDGKEGPKGTDDGKAAVPTDDKPKRTAGGFFANLKLRNPFAKKPTADGGAEGVDKTPEEEEKDEVTAEATDKPADGVEGTGGDTPSPAPADEKKPATEEEPEVQQAPRKGLLEALRVPLASIIPKRFKPVANGDPDDDIELGKTPKNRAGLASMETLDDSLKDAEPKDAVDKGATANGTDGEALVKPDDKEAKDKAAEAEEDAQERSLLQRMQSYRCSVDDIAIIAGVVIFLLLVALIVAFTFIGKSEPITAPVRDGKYIETVTNCGRVEGILEDGSFAFRGIPYAVPPVGPNRWKVAQPIESIEHCWNGTLKAHNSSAVCWQFYADGKVDGSEDCLTLDVITPHVRYDNPLPVVVLVGAESFTGDSPGKLRPSTRYARARDVIFVRPNFRLNVFGFLALEQLTKSTHPPTSGNYGLTDLIVALKWVQLNIPHFGGDPKSVTLFGHRAGGTLVTALASSNKTTKLFARTWISSGAAIFPGKPLADSEKENALYASKVRCEDTNCLMDKEDEEILDAVPDVWRRTFPDLPAADENTTAQHEWLVLDGNIMQQHPADVWSSDVSSTVRYVIGSTTHEAHNTKLHLKYTEWTPELVTRHVNESMVGRLGLTEEALRRYNATYQGLVAMVTDIRTVCPLLTITQKLQSSQFYVVSQTGGELGIADVDSDVQAILGRYEPKTPEQRRYVSAIQQLFYHYVSHGEIKHELRKKLLDVGQDALPTYNTDNCLFWIKNDVVPRYARLD